MLTVEDLIERLREFPPEAIAYAYEGDVLVGEPRSAIVVLERSDVAFGKEYRELAVIGTSDPRGD